KKPIEAQHGRDMRTPDGRDVDNRAVDQLDTCIRREDAGCAHAREVRHRESVAAGLCDALRHEITIASGWICSHGRGAIACARRRMLLRAKHHQYREMNAFLSDCRHALRLYVRTPGSSLIAVAVLALGESDTERLSGGPHGLVDRLADELSTIEAAANLRPPGLIVIGRAHV